MLALALFLLAAPGWAGKPDSADEGGHTFICEGQGKSDDDALAAAQAICNDKICKVCGVEVESITETKETLKGVDFQRKIVERCRRVRTGETALQYKSSDCGPDGCRAWIQIRYTKEDQARECPAYAREDFADPAACEKDITGFSRVEGRTAASFHTRTSLLDDALIHCAKIDVRATPAMMALDSKLQHGLEAFEDARPHTEEDWGRALWTWYLPRYAPLHREISEARLLIDRFRLVRDYVADRALAFEVIEAATAGDWDTPAGMERLRKTMEVAPPGPRYGAPAIHFIKLFDLERAKTDSAAIGALLRKLYRPESVDRNQWQVALYFGSDGHVTQEEWDWSFAAFQHQRCIECLRVLLEAPDHGSPEIREARFFQAWRALPENLTSDKRAFATFKSLSGLKDSAFALSLESKLPESVRGKFDWDYFEMLETHARKDVSPAVKQLVLSRAARALAAQKTMSDQDEHSFCSSLADKLSKLTKEGGDSAPVHQRICSCLSGVLKKDGEGYVNKSDLVEFASLRKLRCSP